MTDYRYPYSPEGRDVRYTPESDPIMRLAMRYAHWRSLDEVMPNASVIVIGGKPIAAGANGSNYHRLHGCRRQASGARTGQGYQLCEGCHPRNHSERRALQRMVERRLDTHGADLYLWGHFGCCPDCWEAIIEAGIRDVYLVEKAETLFNKRHPDNIIGSQFQRYCL
jgi:deoxycytidylate deaminase